MHNLQEIVISKIRELGLENAGEYFGVSHNCCYEWRERRTKIPCHAAQKVLDEIYEDKKKPSADLDWEGSNLTIGMPIHREVEPYTMVCLFQLLWRHEKKIGLDVEIQSDVVRARNRLATRFMRSTAEWLLMVDDDMILPVGRESLYYRMMEKTYEDIPQPFSSFDIITRLTSHELPLVGGLYFGKSHGDVAQYAEAFQSDKEHDKALTAPFDSVFPTRWVATGAMLINRRVFQKIEDHFPDVVTDDSRLENGYFSPIAPGVGEDVSFCLRASKAGIQPHVDMGCVCGHIGKKTFSGKIGVDEAKKTMEMV